MHNVTLKIETYFPTTGHLATPKVNELLLVGGTNVNDQIAELEAGVDIVVATPGRLEDFINTGKLSLRYNTC